MNTIEDSAAQLAAVQRFFDTLGESMGRMPVAAADVPEELAESDA